MMTMSHVTVPNDLESLWMPFTANRQFKRNPRLFVEAEGMHYLTPDGRRHGRSVVCQCWASSQADY